MASLEDAMLDEEEQPPVAMLIDASAPVSEAAGLIKQQLSDEELPELVEVDGATEETAEATAADKYDQEVDALKTPLGVVQTELSNTAEGSDMPPLIPIEQKLQSEHLQVAESLLLVMGNWPPPDPDMSTEVGLTAEPKSQDKWENYLNDTIGISQTLQMTSAEDLNFNQELDSSILLTDSQEPHENSLQLVETQEADDTFAQMPELSQSPILAHDPTASQSQDITPLVQEEVNQLEQTTSELPGSEAPHQPSLDTTLPLPTALELISPMRKRDRSASTDFSEKKRVVSTDQLLETFPENYPLIRNYEGQTTTNTPVRWQENTTEGMEIEAIGKKSSTKYPETNWEQVKTTADYLQVLGKYYAQVPWKLDTWCQFMSWERYRVPGNGWCLVYAVLSAAWKLDWNGQLPSQDVIEDINLFKSQMISKVLQEEVDYILKTIFEVDVNHLKKQSADIYETTKEKYLTSLRIWRDEPIQKSLAWDHWGSTPLVKMLSHALNVKILTLTVGTDQEMTYGEISFPDYTMTNHPLPIKEWLAHYYVQEPPYADPLLICHIHGNHYEAIMKSPNAVTIRVQKSPAKIQPKLTSFFTEKSPQSLPVNTPIKGKLWFGTAFPDALVGGQNLVKIDPPIKTQIDIFVKEVNSKFDALQEEVLSEEKWQKYSELKNKKNLGPKAPKVMKEIISRLDEKLVYVKGMVKNRNAWGTELVLQVQEQKVRLISSDKNLPEVSELATKLLARYEKLPATANRDSRRSVIADVKFWRAVESQSNGKYSNETEPPNIRPNLWKVLAVIGEIAPRVVLLKAMEDAGIEVPPEVYSSERYLYTSLLLQLHDADTSFAKAMERAIGGQSDWVPMNEVLTKWSESIPQEQTSPEPSAPSSAPQHAISESAEGTPPNSSNE